MFIILKDAIFKKCFTISFLPFECRETEERVGQVIADIGKNSREIIRVEVSEFKGRNLINLRIWYQTYDGGYKPTQKGVTLDLSQYGELKEAIAKIGQYVEDMNKGLVPEVNAKIEDSLTDDDDDVDDTESELNV